MTNNKQTMAVEFYLSKIFDIIGDDILDKLSIEQINKIHDLSIQAKEMQKDQHIKSWETGLMKVDFNEYYNETYGGGKQ
jgi:hypothetical protein